VLALRSHCEGLLTALSFSDQVKPQGMFALLPASHTHSSRGKEKGHILLGGGCLPTSEVQIDGTADIFSHSWSLKLKAVKRHRDDQDSPQWPLCTAMVMAVICP